MHDADGGWRMADKSTKPEWFFFSLSTFPEFKVLVGFSVVLFVYIS